MKYIIALQLFFVCAFSDAQNFQINKIVVDKNTKEPLENVSVFNENDYSATNADGKFVFVSKQNKINLNLLGYTEIATDFDNLQKETDTIFMELKATQLQEVVVSNAETFMKKVYDKFKENNLQNYTVNFFLRNILKKDNVNIALQDIYARKNNSTDQKKSLNIEFLNMRKTSLFEKQDHIDYKFSDFNNFFNITAPNIDKSNFTEIPFSDTNFKKVLFETNEKDAAGQTSKGYFIINRKDYALVEYKISFIDDPEKMPYKKLFLLSGKYRTTLFNRFVKFTKDPASNKYYVSISKLEAQVEVFLNKKTEKPFYSDFSMDYFVTNNPTNENINSNFASDKDVFKAKFPYSKDFWDNQNQLPLTTELELFLKSVNENKDKTKEFEVIGNF